MPSFIAANATSSKTRRQEQDQRRMAFRRAIEHYADQRRLQQDISDTAELIALSAQVASQTTSHRMAQPSR